MRLWEILKPKRIKSSAIDILKEYKDRDDIYISFTKIPKIGINPKSDFDNPLGIYAYPLKAAWNIFNITKVSDFPFGSNRPYIWILQSDISDFNNLTKDDFDKLIFYIKDK